MKTISTQTQSQSAPQSKRANVIKIEPKQEGGKLQMSTKAALENSATAKEQRRIEKIKKESIQKAQSRAVTSTILANDLDPSQIVSAPNDYHDGKLGAIDPEEYKFMVNLGGDKGIVALGEGTVKTIQTTNDFTVDGTKGGTITADHLLGLAPSGVVAGLYPHVKNVRVDDGGRILALENATAPDDLDNIIGTEGEIIVTQVGDSVQISLPDLINAPGSIAVRGTGKGILLDNRAALYANNGRVNMPLFTADEFAHEQPTFIGWTGLVKNS